MENLRNVIDFAISREHEAADFYREIQQKVSFDSSVVLLKELEDMELQHARLLEGIFTEQNWEAYVPKDIEDLKISDYMVDPPQHEHMTYQEIFVHAMKREDAASLMYKALANITSDPRVKNLFVRLADEEARHKNILEKMYDDEILKEN